MNESEIFNLAVKLAGAERAKFLDLACQDNPDQRRDVEALLKAHDESQAFLASKPGEEIGTRRREDAEVENQSPEFPRLGFESEQPRAPDFPRPGFRGEGRERGLPRDDNETADNAAENPGTVIAGKYKLLELIGEGGMGTVWLAEQRAPVKRTVALKLIKAGMDSKAVLARFEAERTALALMDHPNIARILDGGVTGEEKGVRPRLCEAPEGPFRQTRPDPFFVGRPYFVMELVKGIPITEFCDARKLTPKERLELFVPVCQAIQHAHQKGIIHRDLKPSNVLVALYDDKPVPKVIDFGLAKATGQALTEQTLNTGFNVVGTPQYMSPEQATFNQLDIDTRTDIYSLGVLLYELLAGSPPFKKQELEKAGLIEILRVIREEEPPRPSTKASTAEGLPSISANRGTEPSKLCGMLRNELDWIVMKALEKDRSRRYETANGFAADINRHLAGEAVLAHPPSRTYRLKKFLRKYKGPVLAASLVFTALLVGVIGTTYGLWQANTQRQNAEKAEDDTLIAYRASTNDAIEQLIGSKDELGPKEKEYLELTLARWLEFAKRKGDDARSRAIRAEGHYCVAELLMKLGRLEESVHEFLAAMEIEQILVANYPDDIEYQRRLAGTLHNLAISQQGLGRYDEAFANVNAAQALLTALVHKSPGNGEFQFQLALAYSNLTGWKYEHGSLGEARVGWETACKIQEQIVDDFPAVAKYQHELAGTYINLGMLQEMAGALDAAKNYFELAIKIRTKLANLPGPRPIYQHQLACSQDTLGRLLAITGDYDRALIEFQSSRDLLQSLVKQFPVVPVYQQELARTINDLANLYRDFGKGDLARPAYLASREIQERLAIQFPSNIEYAIGLADCHNTFGVFLIYSGSPDEARSEWELSRDVMTNVLVQHPNVPAYQDRLIATHQNLGTLLREQGNLKDSRASYQAGCDLAMKLAMASPNVPKYQNDLARIQMSFGYVLSLLNEITRGKEEIISAIERGKSLVQQYPDVLDYQLVLGAGYSHLGEVLKDSGSLDESLLSFNDGIKLLSKIREKSPEWEIAGSVLADVFEGRAQANHRLERFMDAILDFDKALELALPDVKPNFRASRARTLAHTDRITEALAEASELRKSSSTNAHGWYNLACVFAIASSKIPEKNREYAEQAMELLQQAKTAGYDNAPALAKDADLDPLRERDDFKMLQAELNATSSAASAEYAPTNDKSKQP